MKEVLGEEHGAPSFTIQDAKKRYETICTQYEKICNKTTRDADFSDEDIVVYQVMIIHLLRNIEDYLGQEITDRLSYIKLYKSTL